MNWPMWSWGLASPKSIEQVTRLGIQGGVDVAVLRLNSTRPQAERVGRCSMLPFWGEFFLLCETTVFSHKAFNCDWWGSPALWRVIGFPQSLLIKTLAWKISSQQGPDQCLIKLGTKLTHKINHQGRRPQTRIYITVLSFKWLQHSPQASASLL